jgi:hypothetical protein
MKFTLLLCSSRVVSFTDSQKLDSCNEGGLNLISKNNNNHSNNNRNRTTSSNYTINNNELPSDDIDPSPATTIKSERIIRSSSRSHCETENEKLDEHEKSGGDDSQESATENEGDNNNNEDDEREEGKICDGDDATKSGEAIEKSKHYKKKKRRRRKRELTLKSDQSQQIEDDEDDEMVTLKDGALGDDNDGNISDSYINDILIVRKHSSVRRRHSSSSDPVNLSISHKHQHLQDDSDDANIDVETISNAPTKVSFAQSIVFFVLNDSPIFYYLLFFPILFFSR